MVPIAYRRGSIPANAYCHVDRLDLLTGKVIHYYQIFPPISAAPSLEINITKDSHTAASWLR